MSKVLFSTIDADEHDIYKIMLAVAKTHSNATKIIVENNIRPFSLISLIKISIIRIFVIFCALNILIRGKRLSQLYWKKYNIGAYANSAAYRSIQSYNNKLIFFIKYNLSLLRLVRKLVTALDMRADIDCALVDHGCYENGIYVEVFSEYGLQLYYNDYPFGFACVQPTTLSSYADILQIPRDYVSQVSENDIVNIFQNRLENSDSIPYLITQFQDISVRHDFEFLIYAHSFTDAQGNFGSDNAFDNVYQWLNFVLEVLKDRRVCIKAHPGIYVSGYNSQVFDWDLQLFRKIKTLHSDKNNFHFLDKPVMNSSVLKTLNSDCIVVSHHSNALLEAGFLGFKCVASKLSTPWKNFSLFNSWSNKNELRNLLTVGSENLQHTNHDLLLDYLSKLYSIKGGVFGQHWFKTIEMYAGVNKDLLMKDPRVLKVNSAEYRKLVSEICDRMETIVL